jgi:hypothetical protein
MWFDYGQLHLVFMQTQQKPANQFAGFSFGENANGAENANPVA